MITRAARKPPAEKARGTKTAKDRQFVSALARGLVAVVLELVVLYLLRHRRLHLVLP